VVAGEGVIARDRERGREQSRETAWPRAREGKEFLKTEYGRTGQSTVPVRCTPDSAQEKEELARARPVHRTVHSVVSGAHRTVW
jgi:hypothetical protein